MKEDPRKVPLDSCWSLGQLMFTIEECKRLDREDKKNGKKEKEKSRNGQRRR